MCQNNLSIYLLSHLQSSWALVWLRSRWHIFNCCEMDSAVCGGKTGQISLRLPSFTLPDIHREEFDMLQNCDTKLKPSQMWHLLLCHWGKSWNSRRFWGRRILLFLTYSVKKVVSITLILGSSMHWHPMDLYPAGRHMLVDINGVVGKKLSVTSHKKTFIPPPLPAPNCSNRQEGQP